METVKRPARGGEKELVEAAIAAGKKARCYFSHFPVGAAIRLRDGRIISGFNWESPSYPCGVCAERLTIFTAMAVTGMEVGDAEAIAIWGGTDDPISPCGICRQVMLDALGAGVKVLLCDRDGMVSETTVGGLIPGGFKEGDMR